MSLLWLLLGIVQLVTGLRFRGEAGRARFGRLGERRALGVHSLYTGKMRLVSLVVGLSSCVLGLFFATVVGSLPGMIGSGGAVAVLVAAAAVSRRTAVDVAAAFSQRGLEPVQRETSARRDRRQLQFAVVATAANAVSEIARFFSVREDQASLVAVAGVATLVTFVALGAFLWSTAWVFGDEQKV